MPAITTPIEADATQDLVAGAPTFSALLKSIGLAVAHSQTALDDSFIRNVNDLSETTLQVVTDVVLRLDDNGMPMTPDPKKDLMKTEVSVLNYFLPTIHEWRRVAMSMDLTVGSFSSQDGMTFEHNQKSGASGGAGLFWGFFGWFDMSSYDASQTATTIQQRETDFSTGQVRMDALLAPRRTQGFKAPINVENGPQIVVAQGASREIKDSENKVVARETDLVIHVIKADGSDNAGRNVTVECPGVAINYVSTAPFEGSQTNTEGRIKVTLRRSVASGIFGASRRYQVTATLGRIQRSLNVTL